MDAVSVSLFLAVPALGAWLGRPKIPEISSHSQRFLPQRFVVADVQSTGPDPLRDDIVHIAAIMMESDTNHRDGWIGWVRPSRRLGSRRADRRSARRGDTHARPAEHVLADFLHFAGAERLVFFDAAHSMPFLERAAHYAEKKFSNPVSCASRMAQQAFPGLKAAELEALARRARSDSTAMHPALGRCEMALGIYAAAAARLRRIE